MTENQQHVINIIRAFPDQSVPELSRSSGMGAPSLYATLYLLEERGIVTSRWADEDGPRPRKRIYQVAATPS